MIQIPAGKGFANRAQVRVMELNKNTMNVATFTSDAKIASMTAFFSLFLLLMNVRKDRNGPIVIGTVPTTVSMT